MRPLQLDMKAFGSYAEPTTVPFDELRQGLYLITGDTGAGKTTIFDGIVFALYGKASGKDRSPEMMHCDLVDKSTDTEVTLRFSQAGKIYSVTRRIHFRKKRKGEEAYGEAEIQALLCGGDLPPVEGATKVSAACEALLGLNAEQFRKIVMLAQGEFRDFLKADSEKKNEILGKLFDSSAYLWYQRLLEGARARLEQARRGEKEALRELLENRLSLPPEADPARFLPDEPALLDNLDALLQQVRAQSEAEAQKLRAAEQTRDGLLLQKSAGRSRNEALDRLEAGQRRMEELAAQAASIEARRAALERAELALHRALPALREAERSARERDAARENLGELKRRAELLAGEYRLALDARAGDEALTQQRDSLAAQLRELEGQLAGFAELRKAQQAQSAARAARDACRSSMEALDRALAAGERDRQAASEGLNARLDADRLAAEAQREAEEAGRAYAGIAGAGGLRERLRGLQTQERKLAERSRELLRCTNEVLAVRERSNGLYRRFLAGQAALLAGELRRSVERSGVGVCPVCGSSLDRNGLCRLAASDEAVPTQEAVDAARAEAEAMEQDRQKRKEALDRANSQLLSGRELLLSLAAPLLPGCARWEELAAPGFLEQAEAAAGQRSAAARAALDAAQARVRERDLLRGRLHKAEQTLAGLRAELERQRKEQVRAEQDCAAAEREAALLQAGLRFGTEAEARAERTRLSQAHAQLSALLTAHAQREQQCKEGLDRAEGQLRHAQQTLEALTKGAENAAAARAQALAETGFADAAAVSEALLPCRGRTPEDWLRTERGALAGYAQERAALAGTLELLQAQTAGQPRVDLEALEREFLAADAACQALRQTLRRLRQWLENGEALRAQAAGHLAALDASAEAWARLDRLGSLAVGTTGQGGKLSFERYVMGAIFREILEQANRRLDLISGGRYQLVHKRSADRASAKAGLEIEVLDLATGKRRPSASLSGGEAFYTSLALALGLSDAVQSRAGGMKLEALFIDEGFGSLDDDMLDNALAVLNQLTEGDRLVGIISHVDKLGASIPQKLAVRNGPGGSSLRLLR